MAHDAFTTDATTRALPPRAAVAPGRWRAVVGRWAALLARWQRVARSRRRLAALPPELRRDVGLDDLEIATEAEKPFFW